MEPSLPVGHPRAPRPAFAEAAARKKRTEAAAPQARREPISPGGPAGHVRERVEALRRTVADMLDVTPIGVRNRAGRPRPSHAGSRRGYA
ncbi:hypothetical protein [Streptomyces sp. NPDC059466]|uniref:hypothetical protein n=1 Tax=unclassified Streptomyces TaxID=2593676 RepID=UPI003683F0C7